MCFYFCDTMRIIKFYTHQMFFQQAGFFCKKIELNFSIAEGEKKTVRSCIEIEKFKVPTTNALC